MIDFKYDNDLVIENGDFAVVDEPYAGAQRIKDRLLTFISEWFLDLSFGVPYRDNILIKNPRLDVVNAILKAEILKSQDGTFVSFNIELDSDRHMTVEYVLDTTAGIISDSISIGETEIPEPSSETLKWDYAASDDEVAPLADAVVVVSGGVGPYSWAVEGSGFSVSSPTLLGENTISADIASCGTATITVTDSLGGQVTGIVRSTIGQWTPNIGCTYIMWFYHGTGNLQFENYYDTYTKSCGVTQTPSGSLTSKQNLLGYTSVLFTCTTNGWVAGTPSAFSQKGGGVTSAWLGYQKAVVSEVPPDLGLSLIDKDCATVWTC